MVDIYHIDEKAEISGSDFIFWKNAHALIHIGEGDGKKHMTCYNSLAYGICHEISNAFPENKCMFFHLASNVRILAMRPCRSRCWWWPDQWANVCCRSSTKPGPKLRSWKSRWTRADRGQTWWVSWETAGACGTLASDIGFVFGVNEFGVARWCKSSDFKS